MWTFNTCQYGAHPPIRTRVVGVSSPAPPSHAPVMPAANSANVDATTRLISRAVWLAMKAAARRGTPAGTKRIEGYSWRQGKEPPTGCTRIREPPVAKLPQAPTTYGEGGRK